MELKWKAAEKEDGEEKEAKELSVMLDGIERYFASDRGRKEIDSPFCPELTSWLVPEPEYDFSNVAFTILKNEERNGEYHYVVAFDLPPLREARNEAKKKANELLARSRADWGKALTNTYGNFKTPKEKRLFFFMLNCPIVSFLDDDIGLDQKILSARTDSASKELLKLLEWTPKQGSVFYDFPVLSWSYYAQGKSSLFFPKWKEDDEGAFDEARKLYLKGKDVSRILSLLVKSISTNPIGSQKWEYLGGALKATGRYQDATIAYMQSLRQNKNNIWAWKGLAESLKMSGMAENAAGVTWFLQMKAHEE